MAQPDGRDLDAGEYPVSQRVWRPVLPGGRKPKGIGDGIAGAELASKFFDALAAKLPDKRSQIQAEWLQRGTAGLGDADALELFAHALEKTSPLPQPLSQALAVWLQLHNRKPMYRRLVAILRQHPEQGRYFHSASMLPLNILAEVLKP